MASWIHNLAICALICVAAGTRSHSNRQQSINRQVLSGLATYIFDSADENKDDFLDMQELWSIFAAHDINQDSRIELGEYITSMQTGTGVGGNQVVPLGHLAARMFAAADFNHDRTLTNDDALAVFALVDTNHDGKIAKNEFIPRWSQVLLRISRTETPPSST